MVLEEFIPSSTVKKDVELNDEKRLTCDMSGESKRRIQ